ncbi:MAG: hypothetical protein RL235_713 [Chlamydiota bacterium]|jgi:DNA-damage-inducible protein D
MLFQEKFHQEALMSNREVIKKLQSHFDGLAQITPEEGVQFWFARDLQESLGYARWENFLVTITRAIESCKTTGCDPNDHFRGVTKMIGLGKGAERAIEDFDSGKLPGSY